LQETGEKMRFYKFVLLSVIVMTTALLMTSTAALAQDPAPDFLVPLNSPMAAFLESRAVAAQKGATAEFRKMEWVALDTVNNKLYLSMSEINKHMSDDLGDIKLPENNCGIVYEASLDDGFNITSLKPAIVGGPFNKDAKENQCNVNNISNPDSMMVDNKGNLWIGEDTGYHTNNFLWKWDGKILQRYAAMPVGAETTGVYITPANDLFFSVQHPSAMNVYPFNRAAVVVINGFKSTDTFTALPAPVGDAQKTLTLAKGQYQILARPGEAIPQDATTQRWGQINMADGQAEMICNQPDANVFLPTNATGGEGYLYTNYECQPGGVGKMYIRRGTAGWEIMEGENVDFSGVGQTWNNCGSNLSPWNTVLTAEEYEPIATKADWQANVEMMNDNVAGGKANPYNYGWIVELTPDTHGNSIGTMVEKRYAMGRFSHEVAMVMPDQKTVYNGDDGTGVVLFKFVADEPGNMTAGTMFAAKVTQNADESLALKWIELGKGSDDEIAEAIDAIVLP
jgi:secreted PhoX family phosphatase